MQPVYLICGVSGSGKSWICKQLMHKFAYVPHDQHYKAHPYVVYETASLCTKPVLTECPFAERELREDLERRGVKVIPYFVVESPQVVKHRYEAREHKPLPKAALTRATSIIKRAIEWNAPMGTSEQILTKLRELPI